MIILLFMSSSLGLYAIAQESLQEEIDCAVDFNNRQDRTALNGKNQMVLYLHHTTIMLFSIICKSCRSKNLWPACSPFTSYGKHEQWI